MIKRKCRLSGKEFIIEREDLEFYAKMGVITEEQKEKLFSFCHSALDAESSAEKNGSPIGVGEDKVIDEDKIPRDLLIGLPTLCPYERQRRRQAWRNERKLYQRKCDLCEKVIISIYDDQVKFPVYCQNCWWSDKWDAKDYGQDFDFSRDFFSQFMELFNKVPKLSLHCMNNENSEYTNHCGYSKNCYLSFNTDFSEDCLYSTNVAKSREIVDSFFVKNSEICYETLDSINCYGCVFALNSQNCSESFFIKNCIGCHNCFFCTNLRNKNYYIFNKKYTKEDYLQEIKRFKTSSYEELQKLKQEYVEFLKKQFHKYAEISKSENSGIDFIVEAKNTKFSADCFQTEDCKFCFDFKESKDGYDCETGGYKSELTYEMISSGYHNFDCKFSLNVWGNSRDLLYSNTAVSAKDYVGCFGLRNAQYCILNKQYSKEEYFQLREKIIEHMKKTPLKDLNGQATQGVEWGEFFPAKLSPFAYNETVAQEYFPLTKEEAAKRGYRWKEEVINKNYEKLRENFLWENIPDDIAQVEDDICNQILFCERSGKPYKIQKAELRFYRKMNLPIPRLHPDERHKDRMVLRNPRTLFARNCADCGCEIQTTFAPDRPEKVLCEKCYLEVVG